VAELCSIDKEALRALNPQYKKDLIPGNVKPYALRLPQEKLLTFIDLGDSVYNHRSTDLFKRRATVAIDEKAVKEATKNKPVYVTVRKGDNLGSIAKRNRTTVAKIKRLNGMKNNNIRVGKRLRVK
jgi:membrane-bound lytic murein transglycosylase D